MPTRTARAAAFVFAFFALFPTMAHAGEFSVTDEKADTEISEVSRIYLDGQLVSTIKLNDMNRAKTVRVPTPTGRTEHSYTLCGEITIRTPEGRVETHEVSSDGVLHSLMGIISLPLAQTVLRISTCWTRIHPRQPNTGPASQTPAQPPSARHYSPKPPAGGPECYRPSAANRAACSSCVSASTNSSISPSIKRSIL